MVLMAGNPGKLNRRLTIQAKTFTKDSAGGRSESWADTFTVWAELLSMKQAESVLSDAERGTDVRVFRVRYHPSLTTENHRVLYKLQFFDITGISEEGIRDRMLLECRAVKNLTTT
jgi:SPP1 family predicted phage head-tail adaptor